MRDEAGRLIGLSGESFEREDPAAAARALVPPRMTLATREVRVLLTVLSYRHGHFGPALAGPLRRLFPSPLQSNWRLYVDALDGAPLPAPTVFFLANVFDGALYALGTRLFSDALPSHLARRFSLACDGQACAIEIEPVAPVACSACS